VTLYKRWIIIFTCMKIRAVHLEYLYTQSEEEILLALDRFCLARGTPETVYCDRGTYFIGAEDDLRRHWAELNERNPRLRKQFAEIDFYFNPAGAPHYGGHYERLIGIVKKAMATLYQTPKLTDSILSTAMKRAEYLVNARPLAARIRPDSADPQPITPGHFLRGRIYRRLADIGSDGPFSRDWKYVQSIVDHFWQRFLKECAPIYQFDRSTDELGFNFRKGDVVCVITKRSLEHGNWPMGIISDVVTSPDGKVRTVYVQHDGKVDKKAVKDVVLILREEDSTTVSEAGVVLLPQHPERKRRQVPPEPTSEYQPRHLW
jgi:hypothetical protein